MALGVIGKIMREAGRKANHMLGWSQTSLHSSLTCALACVCVSVSIGVRVCASVAASGVRGVQGAVVFGAIGPGVYVRREGKYRMSRGSSDEKKKKKREMKMRKKEGTKERYLLDGMLL